MSSPTASSSQIRLQRLRTGLVFAATAAVVAAAAWMTPRQAPAPRRSPLASQGTALLSARLSSGAILRGDHEAYVAVTMKAPDAPVTRRAPASVAIVLDTSGSMGDENRLEDAKAAAYSLLDRLGPDDELALITYSTAADTVLPLAYATEDTRAAARRAIATMTATGGTNISGGLGLGADALTGAHTALRRIVLISDGEPTEGLGSGITVDPRPLIAFAGRRADQGASITTVGVGLTFREDIMAGIASAGRGNYYFVERAGDLSAMFARELGRLGDTMFTAGELALRPGADVELLEAIGYPLVRDADGWRVPVADLRRGEQRKVVLRVKVRASGTTQDIVAVTWTYRTLSGAAQQQLAVARAMVTSDAAEVERTRDVDALQLIEQARSSAALEQASAAFAAGDGAAANQILVERRAVLQGYAGTLGKDADKAMLDIQHATDRAERDFADAPAASATEGLRAVKGNRAQSYELAH